MRGNAQKSEEIALKTGLAHSSFGSFESGRTVLLTLFIRRNFDVYLEFPPVGQDSMNANIHGRSSSS